MVRPAMSFAELPLPRAVVKTLTERGLTAPFAIQAATLPDALSGRDVLGRGQTGSGKTLVFGLPLLTRTAGQRALPRQPLTLVLVPTRELAQQVTAALTPYAAALRLRCATVVGGLSIQVQADALRRGVTLDREVDRLVRRFLVDPVVHSVDPPSASVTTMAHHLLQVELADKQTTVTEIAAREGRVIMFVDTKHGADRLTRHLLQHGVRAAALHGGKSQDQRTRALAEFRAGVVGALVSTNVAARGIHVDDLDLVVNVDPPTDGKGYVHRGGRTARAGRPGTVVTLVLPHQRREVSRLMAQAGIRPGFADVHPGHPELARLTGARTPSGVPIATGPTPTTARPPTGRVSGRYGRRPR